MALLNPISSSPPIYTPSIGRSSTPPLTSTDERIYNLAQQVINGEQKEVRIALDTRYKIAAIPTCSFSLLEGSTLAKDHKIELLVQPEKEGSKSTARHFDLFLSDSQTSYLKPCDYNFAHLTFTKPENDESYAILHEFTAPDIGGKLALASVRELLKVLKIERCYFQDTSIVQTKKCCKEGVPTSLRLLEIFKNGKGWYEAQGAHLTPPFSSLDFDSFQHLNKEAFDLFKPPVNEEKIKSDYLNLLNQALETTNHNYEKSCTFLYKLTFGQLKGIFSPYQNQEPYKEIYTALIETQKATELSDATRMGDGIRRLVKLDRLNPSKELHALKHRFLDNIVQFNLKQHLFYLQKNIETLPPGPLFFYSLSLALNQTLEIATRTLSSSQEKHTFFKYAFYEEKSCFQSYLRKEMEKELPLLSTRLVSKWKEAPPNPIALNCFKENYDEGLIKVIEHFLLGPSDFDYISYIPKLYKTLRNLRLSDIEGVFPEFSTELKAGVEKLAKTNFKSSNTLAELLEPLKEDGEASDFTLNYLDQKSKTTNLSSILSDETRGFDAFFLAKGEIMEHAPLEFSMAKSA